jgi:hypothetical protein
LRARLAAGAAAVVAVAGLAFAAGTASATTLTCTNVANATLPPVGCGGAQLAYQSKGVLDLAVLGQGSTSGNYWNSPVGFLTDSTSAAREDFTVFAVNGSITDGPGGLGEYVAMYTPDGNVPSFTGTVKGVHGTYSNTTPDIGTSFNPGTNVYCLSVENLNNGPKGALRWRTVLRTCNTNGSFEYGNNSECPTPVITVTPDVTTAAVTCTSYNSVSSSRANRYQIWSPVSGSTGLEMINESLSFDHPHGTNPSNTPYVLDDTAFGGTGTWGLAYPENDGLNQQVSVIGCTDPLKGLEALLPSTYYNCP